MEELTGEKGFICNLKFTVILFLMTTSLAEARAESYDNFLKVDTVDKLVSKIDFQKGFENDIISLNINGCPIVKKIKVTSHPLTELSNLVVHLRYFSDNKYSISYKKVKKKCAYSSSKLVIEIWLNGVYSKNVIDLEDGPFVGISKLRNNTLHLLQSRKRFIYD